MVASKLCNDEHCSDKENKIITLLEKGLHGLTFLLIISLIIIILKELYKLFFKDLFFSDLNIIIHSVLFIFILIEMFTILISYLHKGYIKVERIVEVGIISIVREIIFNVLNVEIARLYALAALLLALGCLFYIEKHFSAVRNV
jgi:uncharacterized membrane protein (DUF373 family)